MKKLNNVPNFEYFGKSIEDGIFASFNHNLFVNYNMRPVLSIYSFINGHKYNLFTKHYAGLIGEHFIENVKLDGELFKHKSLTYSENIGSDRFNHPFGIGSFLIGISKVPHSNGTFISVGTCVGINDRYIILHDINSNKKIEILSLQNAIISITQKLQDMIVLEKMLT